MIPKAAQVPRDMKRLLLPCRFPNKQAFQATTTFVGRETELEYIGKILLPNMSRASLPEESEHTLHSFVLHGLGGSGKTQLALKFVQDQCRDFDAVFFLKADTENRLNEEFCQIAVKLGLEPEGFISSSESCKASVIAWMENPVKCAEKTGVGMLPTHEKSIATEQAKWLIIFDNVDDPELLSTFWPKSGSGSILITSRDPTMSSEYLFPTAHAEVQGLPYGHAADLLELLTGNPGIDRKDARHVAAEELAKKLQGLPLAIEQMGAIMCEQHLDPKSFLDAYQQERDFYALKGLHPGRRNYQHNLETVWALDQLEEPTRALVSIMALMDPESIDGDVLSVGFTLKSKIPHFPGSKVAYYIARGDLLERSIISLQKTPGSDSHVSTAKIHRLVQGVVRSNMANDNAILPAFQQTLESIEAVWPWLGRAYTTGSAEKVGRWTLCAKLFPHIEQLAAVYSEYLRREGNDPIIITLAELLGEAGW